MMAVMVVVMAVVVVAVMAVIDDGGVGSAVGGGGEFGLAFFSFWCEAMGLVRISDLLKMLFYS